MLSVAGSFDQVNNQSLYSISYPRFWCTALSLAWPPLLKFERENGWKTYIHIRLAPSAESEMQAWRLVQDYGGSELGRAVEESNAWTSGI